MNNLDDVSMYGRLKIIEKCNITGVEEVVFDELNKIMRTGYQTFLAGVVDRDQYAYGFDGIYIGDDFGGGTIDDPFPPDDRMVPSDQNVVYRIPDDAIFHNFPQPNILSFTAIIDGNDVLRETGQERNVISSATIRNTQGDIVAYRRFAGRVTSPLITLNIVWTLTIAPQCVDEPDPHVKDLKFFIMTALDESTGNLSPISPEELIGGNGDYMNHVNLRNDDTFYVMAVMEQNDGTLIAYEWDDTLSVNITGDFTSYGTHKPYVRKFKFARNNNNKGSIEICTDGVCGVVTVQREPKMDQYWSGMKPIGYTPPNVFKETQHWQFKKVCGAFVGAEAIGDISEGVRIVWQYNTIEEQISLGNSGDTYSEVIHCDDIPSHVSMAMDNTMHPMVVYEVAGNIYTRKFDMSVGDYIIEKLDEGISPFIINMDAYELAHQVIIVYVDHTRNEIVWRTDADQFATRFAVDTPHEVVDILTVGLTNDRSVKVCYTYRDGDNYMITSVSTEPLGIRLDHTVTLTII